MSTSYAGAGGSASVANAELVARCDQQHEALMNDDITLGMYGEFPPPEGLK